MHGSGLEFTYHIGVECILLINVNIVPFLFLKIEMTKMATVLIYCMQNLPRIIEEWYWGGGGKCIIGISLNLGTAEELLRDYIIIV